MSLEQPREYPRGDTLPDSANYLGPDFYVVRGGTQGKQTKWVLWEEGGLLPTTVIEFLSDSTESEAKSSA